MVSDEKLLKTTGTMESVLEQMTSGSRPATGIYAWFTKYVEEVDTVLCGGLLKITDAAVMQAIYRWLQ